MNQIPTKVEEIDVIYNPKIKPKIKVKDSETSSYWLRQMFHAGHIGYRESFKVMLLSRSNKIIGVRTISEGSATGTVVDPKMIFQVALKTNTQAIILCHNHPSGTMKPSHQDMEITSRLVEGGKMLEIKVLDHIILSGTDNRYYSFADEGLI
jgi:DNA repair protein RadC